MMQVKPCLDAPTSLRFFALATIVIQHSMVLGLFGVYTNFFLGQTVSFFFVLSGFILAYVYSKLNIQSEINYFWQAQIALFASFLLIFWLLPLNWNYQTGLANLFMINAWTSLPSHFFHITHLLGISQ
jgi:peptidoglycan/LPS O-acetylase OafA/YrhL